MPPALELQRRSGLRSAFCRYNNQKMKKAKEAQANAPLSPSGGNRQADVDLQPLIEKTNSR